MFPCIETVRFVDGQACNLDYHQERINRTRKELYGCREILPISTWLSPPAEFLQGIVKCRVVYSTDVMDVTFQVYCQKPMIKLKLLEGGDINYSFKFVNRAQLTSLHLRRGDADDVLIIKDGFITDTSYANIILRLGKQWFTPRHCLLPGTMRQFLLDTGQVEQVVIRVEDLKGFEEFKIVNAMIPLSSSPSIPIPGGIC